MAVQSDETTPLLRPSRAPLSSLLPSPSKRNVSVNDSDGEGEQLSPLSTITRNDYAPGHCHDQMMNKGGKSDIGSQRAKRQLIIASIVCLLFTIGEAIGGILSGSLALLTDAAHMLSDFAGFMVSLFALWMAQRPATKTMSFGFYRAEVVGALVSVFIIWILTGILIYKAVERIQDGEHNIDAKIMLITAGVGVGMNIFLGFLLHGSAAGHLHSHGGGSHGHSHSRRKRSNSRSHSQSSSHNHHGDDANETGERNINVRAAFIHVIGDLIQSIGVLIAAYLIYYKPNLTIVDPICTFLFSILVLFTTFKVFRDGMHVLMEGTPRNISYMEIKEKLEDIYGVKTAHSLHLWSLTMGRTAMAVHLVIDPDSGVQQQAVLETAQRIALKRYGMSHATIQVEVYRSSMDNCQMCQDPKD